jgi:hypothetical protein
MAGFRPASTLLTHPCRTVSGSFGTRHIPGRCCSQPWHGTGCSVGPATGTAALPSVTRDGATAASSCYSSAGPCPGYLDRGMARRRPRRLGPGMGGVRAGSVHRQCSLQPVSHQAGQIGGRRRLHHDRVAAAHPPPRGPAPLRDLADRGASQNLSHRAVLVLRQRPDPPQTPGRYTPSRAARTNRSKISARWRSLPVLHVHDRRVRPRRVRPDPAATVLPSIKKA